MKLLCKFVAGLAKNSAFFRAFFFIKEIYPLHPRNVAPPVDMKWKAILVHPHRGEPQKVFVQKVYLRCVVWIYKKVFSEKVLIYSKE